MIEIISETEGNIPVVKTTEMLTAKDYSTITRVSKGESCSVLS
jgi:hypothetical protein